MSDYSIATAKDQLPRLIDRMLEGEVVTITRRGKPVARVVPAEPTGMTVPHAIDPAWLRSVRDIARTESSGQTDTVRAMRNDYRY